MSDIDDNIILVLCEYEVDSWRSRLVWKKLLNLVIHSTISFYMRSTSTLSDGHERLL